MLSATTANDTNPTSDHNHARPPSSSVPFPTNNAPNNDHLPAIEHLTREEMDRKMTTDMQSVGQRTWRGAPESSYEVEHGAGIRDQSIWIGNVSDDVW